MSKVQCVVALVGLILAGCSSTSDSSGSAGTTSAAGSSASAGSTGNTAGMDGMGGTGSTAGMGGMSDMGGAGGSAGGTAGTAGAAGATASALVAPKLTMLMPMDGGIHVMWTNKQDDCDTIEGERKSDMDPYAVVFSVPGEANNKHDPTASMDMTYTYRLRCKKGDTSSDYSNEMSLNPTK